MMYYSPNKDVVTIGELDFSIYLNSDEIQERVHTIASDISKKYQDKRPIFLVILNGAFIFGSDLFRNLDIACEIQFLRLKSYDKMQSTNKLKIIGLDGVDIAGRDVIIVEDIVDSGFTMNQLLPMLQEMNPNNIEIASLLLKRDAMKYDIEVNYIGFEIPERFVVGYGLDYDEQGRNLSHIYQLIDIIE